MGEFGCVVWILMAIVCTFFGALIGTEKESMVLGGALGLFLGPFGVIAAGFVEGRSRCPTCKERIFTGAHVCPHCAQKLID